MHLQYFSIMGEHLTELGAKQDAKKMEARAPVAPPPVIETAKEKAERLQIEKVLSDPVVRFIFAISEENYASNK